jgi:hypothetical protein
MLLRLCSITVSLFSFLTSLHLQTCACSNSRVALFGILRSSSSGPVHRIDINLGGVGAWVVLTCDFKFEALFSRCFSTRVHSVVFKVKVLISALIHVL